MKVYLVTYDLKLAGQDYAGLIATLKQSPKWWHYMQSTWLIATTESANTLANRLYPHIDQNDLLMVIGVTQEHQGWLPNAAWDWIYANVDTQPCLSNL